MLSTKEIMDFLKENKIFLKENFHCVEIGIFGSFARNEQTEESDIDFLVVFEAGVTNLFDTELGLKNYLSIQFGRPVDICTRKWINPIYTPLVLKETIYA